jgi:hypothetical protein
MKKMGKIGSAAASTGNPAGGDPDQSGISKDEVKAMITQAIEDASEMFALEAKNLEADKLVFETKMRRTMQDLVAPVVEQGVKHKE